MEEAEALCDRLGIFVNGELQCIGNAKEVKVIFLYHAHLTKPGHSKISHVEKGLT